MRKCIIGITTFMMLTLMACGFPDEDEITKSIDNGIKYTTENSWDKALEEAKLIDDYFHVISYRYDKKEGKKLDKQVDELLKSIVVMNKKKSKKKWDNVKKTWNELKK